MPNFRSLNHRIDLDLHPRAPFHFDTTLHKPDHFPSADNAWEPGSRWQTMRWRGKTLGLKLTNKGSLEMPAVRLTIYSADLLEPEFVKSVLDEIGYRYNLDLDLSDFYVRFAGDPQLGPVIQRWRGLRPINFSSLYEYLTIAIVLQNATVRRSVSMMQAMLERYGVPVQYDRRRLYGHWEAKDIADAGEEDLRLLKVGYRAKSFKRVSEAFVRGQIDELALRQQTRSEQRAALLELYGIGPASVGYILSDVFHHLDELEYISPWEQRIYSRLFVDREVNDPVPVSELLDLFKKRYGAYRALAVHYIWEDLFWRHKNEDVPWLEGLVRL
jgi:3-methyladenine DNA glycosylase/8-oxoguanine DNA glycosylase